MAFKKPGSNRRAGSNWFALVMGVLLGLFGVVTLSHGQYPTFGLSPEALVAATSIVFGGVLLIWVCSDWTEWIGGETVNMVIGVVAALFAIASFAKDLVGG